jgi:hypothetical protein
MGTVLVAVGTRWRSVREAAAGKICRMLESVGVLADEETSARYDAVDLELDEREGSPTLRSLGLHASGR